MKKAWIALAAVALLAFPAGAEARGHKPAKPREAINYCKKLNAQMGGDAFRAAYGPQAFRACVKQRVKKLRAARKAAVRTCKQQFQGRKLRRHGKPDRRAPFRRCVREKTKADVDNDDEGIVDAVKQCTADREEDPAAFEDDYGDNESGRDAFAECVAEHADDNEPDDGADPGDDAGVDPEPGDDSGTGDEPADGLPL
jgi:hypothetical protein